MGVVVVVGVVVVGLAAGVVDVVFAAATADAVTVSVFF